MDTNDLNEIICECRRNNLFIKFDSMGMTIEKTGKDSDGSKIRIVSEAFEDGHIVLSFQALIDVALKKLEEECE